MAESDLDAVFFDVTKSSGVVAKELVIKGIRSKMIGSQAYFYLVLSYFYVQSTFLL